MEPTLRPPAPAPCDNERMFPGVIPFILIAAAVIARAVVSIRRDPRRPANALWLTGALIAAWMLVAVLSRGSDPLTGLVFFLALLAPFLVLVLIVVLIANDVVTSKIGRASCRERV